MAPAFLPFVQRWFERAFAEATPPQRDGWAAIAAGRDTLIVAPTGSGKTLAAFLWGLDHLHRLALDGRLEDRVYLVYVSPLRALNNDIEKNLRAPLAGLRATAEEDGLTLPEVRVAVRTSDTLAAARQAMTRRPPHVLITTPESLYILLTSRRFRPALAQVRFVIVDEIHALMGGKRGTHLAVTLERLQALVEAEGAPRPQRIGCSATVRPVEDALAFLTGTTAKEPALVDAGFSREMDVQVVAPVDDFLAADSDTIWDATLQQIAEMVEAHRTTLVFAQSRRAAERLARDLNDRLGDGRVAAHHGSLSRRARLEAENRLKDGELRALVATSSLELGIDVGAIDLVVQVQSPRNVAAALQRVGRAGHLLSRVSKGRIVVTKGEELLEAAAVVRAIRERTLDRLAQPHAPLDVLAQQMVASVAAESLDVETLLARVRRAAPYRDLSRDDFMLVARALAEPLPREVKGVAPRLLWDRVNDRLHARRGSRFLALTSGGTIPDAGLYDVYVAETDLKVGTLDEEFVTESLPGDVFLLGSHAWKIAKVRADRVLVEDAQGMSPTIPFWKGEHPSRSWDLGLGVARLRRDAAARMATPGFDAWAAEQCGLDARAASALQAWLTKAAEVLGGVPDADEIVVESFADEMGGRHAMIHSPFGMRVNGAWGMALRLAVRRRFGLQAEASHVDDGLLLSFAPGQAPPAPERLVRLLAPEDVDMLLGHALIGSPLFTTRFRHCALRALFIARTWNGQRTPPYLQRLKADALMESVGGQAEFPVVAETLRECFHDAFDVPRLKRILERIHDGELRTRHVDTPVPSPFVYPLLLAWDWAYLDAGHAEERRSDAVAMRKAWSVPAGPVDPAIVAAVEAELQKLAPERRARDANEVAALLEELGDLTDAEIAARTAGDAPPMIEALRAERRIAVCGFAGGRQAWIAATDAPLYDALQTPAALERVLTRVLRTRGPLTVEAVAA
ncbi:MAG: DEAD/DEAH box helicase, partial [Candidatus Rokubacteria bacterium]|nr:DEAD/DEAH box helicase [Candidatus Rokubacteria bacterium]